MIEVPVGGLEAVADVGRILSDPGGPDERAAAVLEALRRVVPFAAGEIRMVDTDRRVHASLASVGYPDWVFQYLDSPAAFDDIERLGLDATRPVVRLVDLPTPPDEVPAWAEYLQPAGLVGGTGVALIAADGRQLGFLGLNMDSARPTTKAGCNLLTMVAPMIANAMDPLRSISAAATMVHDAIAGVVIDRVGTVRALPGLATHPLLRAGSGVLAVAVERVSMGGAYVTYLCPYADDRVGEDYLRVTVLACRWVGAYDLVAVVLLSRPEQRVPLTRRELEVLGLLVEGWANQRIAARLVITERTVAAHVEHILAKLQAPSRTAAAVRAFRQGLYLPRALAGRG